MEQAGAGVGSFSQLLDECRPALFRFAVTLTSVDEAEDVVQDALARAWHRREQFDPARGSVQAWVLAIVADQARARWRRRGSVHTNVDLGWAESLPGTGSSAGGETAAAVRVDLLDAVNALAPRQRLAIILSVYVDLPLADVAVVMGCSLGTVKATVHAARAHLATKLGVSYALDR